MKTQSSQWVTHRTQQEREAGTQAGPGTSEEPGFPSEQGVSLCGKHFPERLAKSQEARKGKTSPVGGNNLSTRPGRSPTKILVSA